MKEDLASLLPSVEFTRRQFVVTSLATGFALAVQPVSAETITTDTKGLEAGEVKVPVGEGQTIPAYRAMPAEGGPFAVALVVQEIFGVHEHIKDLCRRFAKAGYFAVAPEMYARQGDVSKIKDIQEIITKVVSKVPDAQVMSDLDATVAWAKKTGKADTAKLGITGFCWGGRVMWLYAAHNPKLKAGVAWYGRLEGKADDLHPKHPLDVVKDLKAPVLGLYGGKDRGIPAESVERMRKALKDADKPSEIVVYPDAEHGFNADYRPSYNKEAAEDGWKKMLAWFKKYGVA
jgi:carboxymethylenebutenolidase